MKNKDWLLGKLIKSKIEIKELKNKLEQIENDCWEIKVENNTLETTVASLKRQLEGKDLMDIKL